MGKGSDAEWATGKFGETSNKQENRNVWGIRKTLKNLQRVV